MANIKISELNELTEKEYTDYIPIVDSSADETKKISVGNLISSNVNLIAVTDTAPATYETGDKYFNTETKKIYTATSSGWANAQDPIENILYVVLEEQTTYVYDNYTESMISVGGGAGGSGGDSTPIGTVEAYAGSTAPNGYLLCDGSAVSRTTYSDLFSVIGTTYGTGDGSTTFNLPNIKGKVVVMLDANDTDFDTLGETGGEKTHTLTVDELPRHAVKFSSEATGNFASAYDGTLHSALSADQNGGQAHNIIQPYIVLNYIIKVQKTAGEVLSEQLPVGTEVDFDGTSADIPIGWEQVTGKTLKTYTLYDGPSTSDSITLSDNASNYSQIEIFYHTVMGFRQSVKVVSYNIVIDFSTPYDNNPNFIIVGAKGTLTNTTLTLSDFYVALNGTINDRANKYVYIDKIIGYKEV